MADFNLSDSQMLFEYLAKNFWNLNAILPIHPSNTILVWHLDLHYMNLIDKCLKTHQDFLRYKTSST